MVDVIGNYQLKNTPRGVFLLTIKIAISEVSVSRGFLLLDLDGHL